MKTSIRRTLLFLLPIVMVACNPLKNIPEGKHFLTRNIVQTDSVKLTSETVYALLKQKPNRKILGVLRFHLGLYNLGSKGDTTVVPHHGIAKLWNGRKIKRWLRSIGEEPVVVDSALTERSRKQLENYFWGKGYFNVRATDSLHFVSTSKRKAEVVYTVHEGQPYKMRNITYSSKDEDLNGVLSTIKPQSLLKTGDNIDQEILDKERDRVNTEIRDRGRYFFNKNYITYTLDSSLENHSIDVELYVNRLYENIDQTSGNAHEPEDHHRYHLNNIYIFNNSDSREKSPTSVITATPYKGYYFVSDLKQDYITKDALLRVIFIKKGDLFYQNDVDYTYSRIADLNLFRFINFRFREIPRDSIQQDYLLDVEIQLSPLEKYEYKVESELTQSGGNLGVAGSLSFLNKNVWKGAETLEFKVSGGLEALRNFADSSQTKKLLFFNTYDIGPELTLGFKQFLLPRFITNRTSRFFNPKSTISTGFSYQERPDYLRVISKISYGINWGIGKRQRIFVYPVEINSVNVKLSQGFAEKLIATKDPNLIYSYKDHLITDIRASWIYSNESPKLKKDYTIIRLSGEVSGFFPWIARNTGIFEKNQLGTYTIFGNAFSNYLKPEIDVSYHQIINPNNTMVYRVTGGVGFTYGNSKDELMPFDKAFFAGGANDIRAWLARTLGPGSYKDPYNIENGGDIKIESNVELRSVLFKILEGAVFVDAGNVWTYNDPSGKLTGAQFNGNDFLKDIAVGAGIGLRFNFTFFIIRTDFAVKFRDPALENPLVYSNKKFNFPSDIVPNLAIGYPF